MAWRTASAVPVDRSQILVPDGTNAPGAIGVVPARFAYIFAPVALTVAPPGASVVTVYGPSVVCGPLRLLGAMVRLGGGALPGALRL